MAGQDRQSPWLTTSVLLKIGAATLILIYIIWILGTWGQPAASRLNTAAFDRYPESDFLCFYAASSLALSGTPATVYHDGRLYQKEASVLHGKDFQPRSFWYPPIYLLIALPFALFPFLNSLILWGLLTLGGYLFILRRIFPHPLTLWAALAFPATFQNLIRGQNGFLSAILMGGGLLLLERAPFIGGLLLGLMVFKPNLAVLIPVALLASRRWRTLGGAAVSALGMGLISLLVFGPGIWLAYKAQLSMIAIKLTPLFGFFYDTTTYALVGGFVSSPETARIFQFMVMGLVGLAVVWAWSRKASLANRGPILILGILLFSPHVLIYDLTLLGLALAWMASQGLEKGWLAGETHMMLLGWLLPFYSPLLAAITHIIIAPAILGGLFFLNIRRLYLEQNPSTILHVTRFALKQGKFGD